MLPLSSKFLQALNFSHRMVSSAKVFTAAGTQILDLGPYLMGGQVTFDKKAQFRRQVTLTVADSFHTLMPTSSTDALTSYGNEIRLSRGIIFQDGTSETVPLGVFGISSVKAVTTSGGQAITLTGYDRSRKVSRRRLPTTYVYDSANIDVSAAIQNIISHYWPAAIFTVTSFGYATAALGLHAIQPGDDPWKAAADLASSAGGEVFFDATGVCVIRPEPDPSTTAAVWTVAQGVNLTSIERTLDDTDSYNDVYVMQDNPAINYYPAQAREFDNNPQSPTYINGDFGDVVLRFNNPFLNDNVQADVQAKALLKKGLGMTDTLTVDCLPNPAIDASDPVLIQHSGTKTSGVYIVDSGAIGITAGDLLSLTCKGKVTQ